MPSFHATRRVVRHCAAVLIIYSHHDRICSSNRRRGRRAAGKPPKCACAGSGASSTSRPGARCRSSPRRARADAADELWLARASAGLHARRRRARRAPAARRERHTRSSRSDRGGQITYHGPGQVVLYLLLDLRRRGLAVRPLVRMMEHAVIDLLAAYGVAAAGRVEAPGVYVDGAKIAALGLRIRERLLLSRARLQRRHGSLPFPRDRPLRLFRPRGDAGARSRHQRRRRNSWARSSSGTCCGQLRMSAIGEKQKGRLKTARIPIKVVPAAPLAKPDWIRVRLGNGERFQRDQAASCASTACTPCARKRPAPTSASASARAPRPS